MDEYDSQRKTKQKGNKHLGINRNLDNIAFN